MDKNLYLTISRYNGNITLFYFLAIWPSTFFTTLPLRTTIFVGSVNASPSGEYHLRGRGCSWHTHLPVGSN